MPLRTQVSRTLKGEMADDETTSTFNLDETLAPVRDRSLRRLPSLIRGSVQLVRTAARREVFWFAVVQVLGAVAVGAQLLAGKEVLNRILASTDGGSGTFSDVLPWLGALALATTVTSFANTFKNEQQTLLTELVSRHATGTVLDVASHVKLLAFEHPVFHDRLQRALANATTRPIQ